MEDKVKGLRDDMSKEKLNDSEGKATAVMPKPGQFSRFALLTKKDNVKIARKKSKIAADKLAKLKLKLMQQLKDFKEEQYEIFAGVPETKHVEIVPMISQGESNYLQQDSRQN